MVGIDFRCMERGGYRPVVAAPPLSLSRSLSVKYILKMLSYIDLYWPSMEMFAMNVLILSSNYLPAMENLCLFTHVYRVSPWFLRPSSLSCQRLKRAFVIKMCSL